MSTRPYKPPPESFGFQLLKVFWTVLALVAICGFFMAVFVWPVSLLHPPVWMMAPLLAIYGVLCVGTYLFLKATTLGKYLCDWPKHFTF